MSRWIAKLTGRSEHRVAIVLGSGLSELARSLVGARGVSYEDIDGMPVSNVEGHEGRLYAGEVSGVPTLIFAGRAHLHEGYDAQEVTFAVRQAVEAGCEMVVLTNAAGGINETLGVGAPCLISDHINLTATSPLIGPSGERRDRFVDLTDLYDPELRRLAKSVDPSLEEGVYAGVVGPTYETPAEIRMLAALGADLVGMSTVLEAIAARAMGARVLGLSVVTNRAAGLAPARLTHEEVAQAARRAAPRMERILREVVGALSF